MNNFSVKVCSKYCLDILKNYLLFTEFEFNRAFFIFINSGKPPLETNIPSDSTFPIKHTHTYIHVFPDFNDKWLEKINHSTVILRVNEAGRSCCLFLEAFLIIDTFFPYEQLKQLSLILKAG